MGCCCSNDIPTDESILGRNKESYVLLQTVYSKKEIFQLYDKFKEMDLKNENKIKYDTFFGYLRLEKTPMNMKIFRAMHAEEDPLNNKITFLEFCLMLWMFLSLQSNAIGPFAFMLFATGLYIPYCLISL